MALRGLVFSLLELSCIIHFATGDRFIRAVEDVIILHSTTAARKCAKHTHVFKESIPLFSSRTDLTKQTAIRSDHVHEVVFVVQQKRMDHITRLLHEVSDPASPNYGQHLSGEQISAITSNHEARDTIADFLNANGVLTMSETLSGDFITANAPISVWEKLFDTTFFVFTQRHRNGDLEEIVRAETYSIPRELDLHVESVLNTVELPVRTSRRLYRTSSTLTDRRMRELSTAPTGFLLPSDIRAYYNLTDVYGSEESTQSAVAFGSNYFSQSSLAYFQQYMSYQSLQPALNVGGYESDDPNLESTEGDLDIQYLMGISPTSPTTFWHASSGWVSWLTAVLNTPNPPLVHSISYGSDEQYTSLSTFKVMTTFAQKLGLMGVTLVAASGDDGAQSPDARNDQTSCGYMPSFPGTNPYVTTIGATSGPESGRSEVVCQWDTGNSITSGGGFSDHYARPEWQNEAVNAYMAARDASGEIPVTGYNTSRRGYPDISLAGSNYHIRVPSMSDSTGVTVGVAGTSASSPVAAAFFSNINAARLAAGKGSIGWLNPVLYAKGSSFVNDITFGNNKSPIGGPICSEGYYATTGWDPTTGLGSVDYAKMHETFLALGEMNGMINMPPSRAPTKRPSTFQPTALQTEAPSLTPISDAAPSAILTVISIPSPIPTSTPSSLPTGTPTLRPSVMPTVMPSSMPTFMPSAVPTIRPTVKPTSSPTSAPSVVPTIRPIVKPTSSPTSLPSVVPTIRPTVKPTSSPTSLSSVVPTIVLSVAPTVKPSAVQSTRPSAVQTLNPSILPSFMPSIIPMIAPTVLPAPATRQPTHAPSAYYSKPSAVPTMSPSSAPIFRYTKRPTRNPVSRRPSI